LLLIHICIEILLLTYKYEEMLLIVLFQIIFGSQITVQQIQSDELALANQLLHLVESNDQYSSDLIDLTKDLRDIFDDSIKIESDEILIRVLRFENAILFSKTKPMLNPKDVLMIKNKIKGKDSDSAIRRAMALIRLAVGR